MLSKEYLSNPCMNQSSLKVILDGVDDFKWKIDHPPAEMTDAQIIGSAFHILVLQPHLAHTIMKIPKINKKTREGIIFTLLRQGKDTSFFPIAKKKKKNQKEGLFYEVDLEELDFIYEMKETHHHLFNASPDNLFIDKDDYDIAEQMAVSALKNDDTRDILSRCTEFEKSYFFTYKGIKFKAQLDGRGHMFIADLKSTVILNNEHDLEREIYKRKYHFQGAAYLTGAADGQLDDWFCLEDWEYYILFVRNVPPYTVIPKVLSADKIRMGFELFNEACDLYNHCLINNPHFIVNHKLRAI